MTVSPTFSKLKKEYLKTLKQYVPVVDRVHGGNHPEFHDVRQVFDVITGKIALSKSGSLDLSAEFASLREITHHYTVPPDVCETYEAVYKMLSQLDDAYRTK